LSRSYRAALAPWLVAIAGAALAFWMFAPGWLSFDSAYQWQQARTGQIDALHPPLQTLLWSLIEPYWSGPSSQLLLQQMMVWMGLAGIAASLHAHWGLRAVLVGLVGLWPPLLLLSAHIWKDIPMLGAFALAVWMLRLELRHPGWRYRGLALLTLLIACACRHNAITGAAPLLLWIGWRALGDFPRLAARSPIARLLWALPPALLASLALQALAQVPNFAPGVKRTEAVWSVVALWDMAAVSIAEDRLLIPQDFRLPDTRVEHLREHFVDFSNTTVFNSGKLMPTLVVDYSDAQIDALRRAWLALPFGHPRTYFAHRLRLAELLLGFDNAALPDHQVLMPGFVAYRDNPPIVQSPNSLREGLLDWTLRHIDGPLFMGWLYLLLALATGLAALPGLLRDRAHAALAGAVAASALAYALPLVLVSGSAEFRYLAWPLQASLLAPALLYFGAERRAAPAESAV
jgi:hypothetical protein